MSEISLGARIKTLREGRGWSQRTLDKRANFAHGYTSKLESNRVKSPGLRVMKRLAEALGVSITRFSDSEEGIETASRIHSINDEPVMREHSDAVFVASQIAIPDLVEIQADLSVIERIAPER